MVIDDGSIDDTHNIVNSINDERITYYYKNNGGLSDARNFGIEKSKGKYLLFLDADDYLDSKCIEILYKNIIQYDSKVIQMKYIRTKEYKYANNFNNYNVKHIKNDILVRYLQSNNYSVCTKLYHKSCFEEIKFPYGRKYEDFYTNFLIFKSIDNFVDISYAGYYYVLSGESITRSKLANSDFDVCDLIFYTNFLIFKSIDNFVDISYAGYYYVLSGESITRSKLANSDFDVCDLILEMIKMEKNSSVLELLQCQLLLAKIGLIIKGIKYGIEDNEHKQKIIQFINETVVIIRKKIFFILKNKNFPLKKKLFSLIKYGIEDNEHKQKIIQFINETVVIIRKKIFFILKNKNFPLKKKLFSLIFFLPKNLINKLCK